MLLSACAPAAAPAGGSGAAAAPAADQTFTLRFAYMVATHPESLHTIVANEFKAELERLTNGNIEVIIHPGGELGNEREYAEMLITGDIAFASMAPQGVIGFTSAIEFLDIPALFTSQDELIEFASTDIARARLDMLEDVGIVGLGITAVGPRMLVTVPDRPINSLDDMVGLRMRTLENPVHIEGMGLMGTLPTPLPWPEVFTSLQTGVIDGIETLFDTFIAQRIYEVAPNFALVPWYHMVYLLAGSQSAINALPERYQAYVWQAAEHATRVGNEFAVYYVENIGMVRVHEVGANVTSPDPQPFFNAMAPMLETHRTTIGEEVLEWLAERRS